MSITNLKEKILSETEEERKARSEELAEKLKAAGIDVGEVLLRFRLEDPELVREIYKDILKEDEEKPETAEAPVLTTPRSIEKLISGSTSLGEAIGYMMLYDWWEDRKEKRQRAYNPEVEMLKAEINTLKEMLTKIVERESKKEEEEARKRELDIIRGELSALKAHLMEMRTGSPKVDETPIVKELRERLDSTLKKVEELEGVLRSKEIEGVKVDILTKLKEEVEPIKNEVLRMQGRLEESQSSKSGSVDRHLARELKLLSILDQRLAAIEAKLPTAHEASEIIRQLQPPQIRTTPPRTEQQKLETYKEAIKKLEEKTEEVTAVQKK